MLTRFLSKIKDITSPLEERDIYFALIIILVGLGSYGLGIHSASGIKKPEIIIKGGESAMTLPSISKTEQSTETMAVAAVFASKNGTRYYFPWCTGLARIKEENKISFSSTGEAEAAGYAIASGCK